MHCRWRAIVMLEIKAFYYLFFTITESVKDVDKWVFALFLLRVFILCMTDTNDVALLELKGAVLLISHLRFCWKYICAFMATWRQEI